MEDEGLPLRRRVPGAARAGPGSSVAPVLPDAVLRRMQAAVDAARVDVVVHDQDPTTDPIPRISASEPARDQQSAGAANGVHVKPDPAARPRRPAKRRGVETPGGKIKHGRLVRLPRRANGTRAAITKPAANSPSPLDSVTDIPMRTVPTPARGFQPPAPSRRAAPVQPAPPRELPVRPSGPSSEPTTAVSRTAEPLPVD